MEPLQPFDPMWCGETWWEKHQYDYDDDSESVYEITDDFDSRSVDDLQR